MFDKRVIGRKTEKGVYGTDRGAVQIDEELLERKKSLRIL